MVKLNAGNIAKIVDTAATLSPESSFSNYKIYLKKDTPVEPYVGDSQNLAYLLSLIHCGRELRLSHRDIWCTGSIEQSMRLKQVDMSGFEIKLKAFLSPKNRDKLFIVPAANIQAFKHNCHEEQCKIIALNEFQQMKILKEKPSHKYILAIHATELERLVNSLFQRQSAFQTNSKKTACVLLGIVWVFILMWCFQYLTTSEPLVSPETKRICFYDFPTDCIEQFYHSSKTTPLFENLFLAQTNETNKQCRCYSLSTSASLATINQSLSHYLQVNAPNKYEAIPIDNTQLNVYFNSGFIH